MAKSSFLKTFNKNISSNLNKYPTSILLIILFIFTIVLFFIFNKSIEKFTCASPDYGVEIIYWTREDAPQKYILYTLKHWPKFVRENYNFANLILEHRDYRLINSYINKTDNPEFKDVDLSNKELFPVVSFFIHDKINNKKKYAFIMVGEMLSAGGDTPHTYTQLYYDYIKQLNYAKLYSNAENCTT